MKKGLAILFFSCLVVVFYILVKRVAADYRWVSWIVGMSLAESLKLKFTGYNGLPSLLGIIALGMFFYADLWLKPAGVVTNGHLVLLIFLVAGLGYWERITMQQKGTGRTPSKSDRR